MLLGFATKRCTSSHLCPRWPAGAYGVVNLCVDRRSGSEYACKVLPKVRGRLTPAKTAKKIWQEVELLSRVQSCGNVARLQSVFEDDERVYIVLELCQGGDLEQLLEVRVFWHFSISEVLLRLQCSLQFASNCWCSRICTIV